MCVCMYVFMRARRGLCTSPAPSVAARWTTPTAMWWAPSSLHSPCTLQPLGTDILPRPGLAVSLQRQAPSPVPLFPRSPCASMPFRACGVQHATCCGQCWWARCEIPTALQAPPLSFTEGAQPAGRVQAAVRTTAPAPMGAGGPRPAPARRTHSQVHGFHSSLLFRFPCTVAPEMHFRSRRFSCSPGLGRERPGRPRGPQSLRSALKPGAGLVFILRPCWGPCLLQDWWAWVAGRSGLQENALLWTAVAAGRRSVWVLCALWGAQPYLNHVCNCPWCVRFVQNS